MHTAQTHGSPHPPARGGFSAWSVVRFFARLAAVLSLLLLGAFAFGGGETSILSASRAELLPLLFFPGGVALGMVIGLAGILAHPARRYEVMGGAVTLASLAAFFILFAITTGNTPHGPWFAIFALPGLVMLIVGLAAQDA